MNPLGFVLPAASIGLGALLIRPQRGFFITPTTQGSPPQTLIAQATLEERHHDELEITEHPVEQGAAIADHAFKRPAEVIIRMGWSNSPSKPGGLISQAVGIGTALGGSIVSALASVPSTAQAAQSLLRGNDPGQIKQIYQKLLKLQQDRALFDIYTGKRAYTSMLMRSLSVDTDPNTENVLMVTVVCRQVLIALTQTVLISGNQAEPEQTQPVQEQGPQQLQPAPNFMPDPGSLSGALDSLQGGFTQVTESLASVSTDIMSELSGPISQLGDVVTSASEAVNNVISQLPLPFEIPLIPNPQELSLSLESIDLKGTLGDAIRGLPDTLTDARGVITSAQQQLPSIMGQITPALDALPGQLTQVQDQIRGSLSQITRVLSR